MFTKNVDRKIIVMEASDLPMLSVTVMMLRLIVESVILLKDEDCKDEKKELQ